LTRAFYMGEFPIRPNLAGLLKHHRIAFYHFGNLLFQRRGLFDHQLDDWLAVNGANSHADHAGYCAHGSRA